MGSMVSLHFPKCVAWLVSHPRRAPCDDPQQHWPCPLARVGLCLPCGVRPGQPHGSRWPSVHLPTFQPHFSHLGPAHGKGPGGGCPSSTRGGGPGAGRECTCPQVALWPSPPSGCDHPPPAPQQLPAHMSCSGVTQVGAPTPRACPLPCWEARGCRLARTRLSYSQSGGDRGRGTALASRGSLGPASSHTDPRKALSVRPRSGPLEQ